jgi:type VI secretion system ImpB/VipA family protein
MTEPISFGELDIEIVAQMEEAQGAPDPETPFRIAVLGDFSGRANRQIIDNELADRKPVLVDRDNIDEVLKKLRVEIALPVMGKDSPPVRAAFSGMDDFHPDRLFERLDIFGALRYTRQAIKDPASFASLVKEFQSPAKPPAPADTKKYPHRLPVISLTRSWRKQRPNPQQPEGQGAHPNGTTSCARSSSLTSCPI